MSRVTLSEETQFDVPARQPMLVERRDWLRIKRNVSLIKGTNNRWENAAWFSSSTTVTLGIVVLSSSSKTSWLIGTMFSTLITVILFTASRAFSKDVTISAQQIALDMNEVEDGIIDGRQKPGQTLKVHRAKYGTAARAVDVTEFIKRRTHGGRLSIPVSNALTPDGDPDPGVIKELIIEYSLGGVRTVRTYLEGESVDLP